MRYGLFLALSALSASALSACHALPRDPAETSKRIAEDKIFVVAQVETDVTQDPRSKALIARLEQNTAAHADWRPGSGETLLQKLKQGKVDLVLGRFRKDSPWRTEVAFGPPLSSTGPRDDPIELKAAMRNGENRWIMTVESASRAVAGTPRP